MKFAIAVDIGGTFTDLVSQNLKTGAITVSKVPSIREAPSNAVLNAINRIDLTPSDIGYFAYATTVATNALIQRKGAKTGLIATKGFRDLIGIQRCNRKEHYGYRWVKPEPLVPRQLRTEVEERVDHNGKVLKKLNEDDVVAAIKYFKGNGVESVAVSFLFSFLYPEHEKHVEELIKKYHPEAKVSLSSTVLPQWREFERTSTTVIDAYIKPLVDDHLTHLERMITEKGFRSRLFILKSAGGILTLDGARDLPVQIIKSGPTGGVMATGFLGKLTGFDNLISIDMGGTSFDVALIRRGQLTYTTKEEVEFGIPVALPMIDCRSIGAGGGSLAWVDKTGALRVGPQSAGSNPGPVCYGLGNTTPTVTDANVALGRLNPEHLLSGDVKLKPALTYAALDKMGKDAGMDSYELAYGILKVVNSNMSQAMRLISVDRGADPRDFSVVAFGGAGPLHAVELAAASDMAQVIVPPFPGAFSAFGGLVSDVKFDYTRTHVMRSDRLDASKVNEVYADMEKKGLRQLEEQGIETVNPVIIRRAELRYVGQNYELEIPVPNKELTLEDLLDARRRFDQEHEKQYGFIIEDETCEFINYSVSIIVEREKANLPQLETKDKEPITSSRDVFFAETNGFKDTPIYNRSLLSPRSTIKGPAIIEQFDSTTVIPPHRTGEIDAYGNIIVKVK
ncbi:MAG: hydantoinase/oxoprolinase family protein [Candidatus Bathyarchaeia archaeon]